MAAGCASSVRVLTSVAKSTGAPVCSHMYLHVIVCRRTCSARGYSVCSWESGRALWLPVGVHMQAVCVCVCVSAIVFQLFTVTFTA